MLTSFLVIYNQQQSFVKTYQRQKVTRKSHLGKCILKDFFFYWPDTKAKISGIGVTPLTSSTVQWHTSITAPPLFEVYNGVKCWLHRYLLFFVWPCSLARSCRRCCCRSAAREGELQGRWPSRHAALQGLRPALCCVPRNERLAGFLMWSYF